MTEEAVDASAFFFVCNKKLLVVINYLAEF